jgi:hypothetical protein
MNAFATQTPKFREQFFRQYQSLKGIDPIISEKDFWVCWLLARIFEHPGLSRTCLFKSGTSLSKVFHAIERFSEDIDLGITPESLGWPENELDEAPSRTKREERSAKLEESCAKVVHEHWLPELENATRRILGTPQKQSSWLTYRLDEASHSPTIFFAYPGALPLGPVSYITREVKIEFGSLTDQQPTGKHPIQAFVSDLAPETFNDMKVEVVALELERTFWEKATILHAEFHRPANKPIKDRYARHYADFAALWKLPAAHAARSRFDILERVRKHKSRFFPSGWANYGTAIPGTLRLAPAQDRIQSLRTDYMAMQQMFIGDPLPFDEIISTLTEAEGILNKQG